ncbi:MAG: type I 3-dehydroquinate dehydratase, partial [Spirochaetaceae bacterium]|nr:type I 3-dehydroquinate dehydratase [Spirochaetaceae bacterium]
MFRSKICLCLTGSTIAENLQYVNRYRNWIDMVELRADHLTPDERLHIRKFPELAGIPAILTIRRRIDGGKFIAGEGARTILFARGLAFADQDTRKNFAYIDLESDFYVPSIQDAARAFGTKVIRSIHNMQGPVIDLPEQVKKLSATGADIVKIAFMPRSLSDVTKLFVQARELEGKNMILIAMGNTGLPSRILASKLHSFCTYTSPAEIIENPAAPGQLDPITLCTTYNFRSVDDDTTDLFGITGYPLLHTNSPAIHNQGYHEKRMNAAYVPFAAKHVEESLEFANSLGLKGFSVTVPHKETILSSLGQISAETGDIGACNTVVKRDGSWYGYNTDATGISRALLEFLGVKNLKKIKVSIIGAGGAARATAHAVKELHGKACIFNRTVSRAKQIAELYNFKWTALDPSSEYLLEEYS